jgi:Uma2 family endonuclease
MALPEPKERLYTVEDVYGLPEGVRAELFDGRMHMMAPPSRAHQGFAGELAYQIRACIKKHGGSCKVYEAPFAVFLFDDGRNYVEPDISVVCDPKKLSDAGCNGAPDWVIEIVSPATASHDYEKKLNLYEMAGVREYWIVDLRDGGKVVVYDFEHGALAQQHGLAGTVASRVLGPLSVDFSSIDP